MHVNPNLQASTNADAASLFHRLDLHSSLSTRLTYDGQLIGVLNLVTRGQPREFSAGELALLKGLADQAALAISNARLFARVERQNDELEARVARCDFSQFPL